MLGKFRRYNNDLFSNRKRLLKDKLVELLGYNLISVRDIEKLSLSEKERRLEQVKELQSNLLAKEDPSSWGMLPFNQLKFSIADLPPEPAEPEYAPDVLFQNSIGPQLSLFEAYLVSIQTIAPAPWMVPFCTYPGWMPGSVLV